VKDRIHKTIQQCPGYLSHSQAVNAYERFNETDNAKLTDYLRKSKIGSLYNFSSDFELESGIFKVVLNSACLFLGSLNPFALGVVLEIQFVVSIQISIGISNIVN
jgi:hypothetical protein